MTIETGVPIEHCGQSKRAIVPSVFIVADPNRRVLQEFDHDGEHLAPRQTACSQVDLNTLPNTRQGFGESSQALVLARIPNLVPARGVAVLLPPPRVATSRLNVSVGLRADPAVGPARRDYQRLDALDRLAFANALPAVA